MEQNYTNPTDDSFLTPPPPFNTRNLMVRLLIIGLFCYLLLLLNAPYANQQKQQQKLIKQCEEKLDSTVCWQLGYESLHPKRQASAKDKVKALLAKGFPLIAPVLKVSHKSRDLNQALYYFKKACELENGDGCHWIAFTLNEFFPKETRSENAPIVEEFYRKAIELNNPRAHNALALILQERKEYDEAGKLFLRGHELGDAFSYLNLAQMEIDDLGKKEEGIEKFKFLCDNPPNYTASGRSGFTVSHCSNVGHLLETSGRIDEAKTFYLKSIKRDEQAEKYRCAPSCRCDSYECSRIRRGKDFAAERLAELESKEGNKTKAKEYRKLAKRFKSEG